MMIFQLYFGYGLSFLLGIYGSSLNLFGLGWRAAYILAGGLGLPVAALLLLVGHHRDTGPCKIWLLKGLSTKF